MNRGAPQNAAAAALTGAMLPGSVHVETVGEGQELILLHGWSLHGGVWAPLAQALAPRFRVHRVDLPGHGWSPPVSPYGLEQLVSALQQRFPQAQAVVGWSLGGLVAQAWALRCPSIERLGLIATSPCFMARPDWPTAIPASALESFATQLELDYRATLNRFLALQVLHSEGGRRLLAALRERLYDRPVPSPSGLRDGLAVLRDVDLRPEVGRIQARCLLIHGDKDTLVPHGAGTWLSQQLGAAELHRLPDAAHLPFLSHQDECVRLLMDFLN